MPGNPDLPAELVHFTGRTRSAATPLPAGLPMTASQRLGEIVRTGYLRGFRAGTEGPVVCFAELTASAVQHQLVSGFTTRGPYEPFGVLIHKSAAVTAGARQVWYVEPARWSDTDRLPTRELRDRRVKSLPGSAIDWTHEREWRIALRPESAPPRWDLPPEAIAGIITDDPYIRDVMPAPAFVGADVWLFNSGDLLYAGALGDPIST